MYDGSLHCIGDCSRVIEVVTCGVIFSLARMRGELELSSLGSFSPL